MIDTGGRVLAQASAGYPVTSAMAGYAESEPAHWWSAVTACAREAVHEAVRAGGARPSAIGLSGQMHGLVLTSADGAGPAPGPALGRQPRHRVAARLPAASARARWPGWPTRWPPA